MDGIRINKFLSEAGVCSRREADRLVADGLVFVDGKVATAGIKVFPEQEITYQGRKIEKQTEQILLAFYKPKGVISTTKDKNAPNNIIDFIHYEKRIFPIGRLDKDSEGLILLTNDGALAEQISRSRYGHEKEYIVTVNHPVTEEFLRGMRAGVPILDTITKQCKVEAVGNRTFRIILTQGLNRQIRRMCEYFDYRVTKLVRIRIMNIRLDSLAVGEWRNVTKEEKRLLYQTLKNETK